MNQIQLSDSFIEFLSYLKNDNNFKQLQYYMRCLKKAPHGGVFCNNHQSMFLCYYPIEIYPFLNKNIDVPYPIKLYKEELKIIIDKHHISIEELLEFCFCENEYISQKLNFKIEPDGYRMYAAFCSGTLSLIESEKHDFDEMVAKAIDNQIKILDYFDYDYSRMLEIFLLHAVKEIESPFKTIEDIKSIEALDEDCDKYGLSNVSSAIFERQGFTINGKFYLYNLFLDTSIGSANSSIPKAIEAFKRISNVSIFMRKDSGLSVLAKSKATSASHDLQKWRGITLHLNNLENSIIKTKEVIVHFCPETMHKVLVIVKPEKSNNNEFYFNISVEELWSPDSLFNSEKVVLTNFIHGCYFPSIKSFDHIDFSVNQYDRDVFEKKYRDCVLDTAVPIEKYSEEHYKVWCVKSNELTLKVWSELVFNTLDAPFRNLFAEIIGAKTDEE